jgi:UDP-N-acetylmuramoyl-L-alanyl-D-glutamate--2,6-diaminopimelate ligase
VGRSAGIELGELLAGVDFETGQIPNPVVSSIVQNSELATAGAVFAALPGATSSGLAFVERALARGAVAVLVDDSLSSQPELASLRAAHPDIAIVTVPELRSKLGSLAAKVFGTAEQGLRLFGVTGTNGKTSTVTYLQRLLEKLGESTGLSASTERIAGGEALSAGLTTPEVCELHQLLAQMRSGNDTAAAIEVSAQALVRNRVDGLFFEVVGFTNLSRDHLDDFGTMDEYLAAKLRLFQGFRAGHGVVFAGDAYALEVVRQAGVAVTTIGPDADWSYRFGAGRLVLSHEATELAIDWSGGELMARNLALALVMLTVAGFDPVELAVAAREIDPRVAGRLDLIANSGPACFIDYAHTPDAIAEALASLSDYPWVTIVFGASGNRDAGKRPEMARAAAAANLMVITDQHPRDENPAEIRATLLSAALAEVGPERVIEVAEPELAIRTALAATPKDGAVIWCGPGNLRYREVAGSKVAFDARQVFLEALRA